MMRSRLGILCLAACLAVLAFPLKAARGLPARHVQAQLVAAQDAVVAGKPLRAGIRLTMEEHWHIYWKNPGDTGLPTEVAWQLPQGWKAGNLQLPYPERLETAGLVSYGYSGQTILLVDLQPPADLKSGSPVTLKAHVKWLACAETCIPEEADVSLELPVAAQAGPGPDSEALDQFAARIPTVDPSLKLQAEATRGGLAILLGENAFKAAAFFPDGPDQIDYAAPQSLSKGRLELRASAGKQPEQLQGVLVVTPEQGPERAVQVDLKVGAAPTPATTPDRPGNGQVQGAATALFFAFVGGMILNLMPCVFPVLSMKVLGFVETANQEQGKPWVHGAVFALGVLLSFWALAGLLLLLRAGGAQLGWGFQLQSPGFVVALAVLFFFIALNLTGCFEIGLGLTRLGDVAERKSGLAGSFWSGVLATVVATPCTAPFMSGAIGFAVQAPPLTAIGIFTMLGAGMAFPYVLLTSIPALLRFVPRPGAWMESFKQFLAFPMFATVVILAWVLGRQRGPDAMVTLLLGLVLLGVAAWAYGRWSCSLKPRARALGMATAALFLLTGGLLTGQSATTGENYRPGGVVEQGSLTWEPWSPERVAAARAQGKPVFVDFTAAWCLSCQVNERSFGSSEVQEEFSKRGVVTLKGDWTNRDEAITRALAGFGRSGVPLYVLYPPGEEPVVLPELLTPGIVLEALKKLPDSRAAR